MRDEPIYFDECFPVRLLIEGYVAGKLKAESGIRVEEHLRVCIACMDVYHKHRSKRMFAQAEGETLLEGLLGEGL